MIENTILSSLIFSDEYIRKVIPYIKVEYFPATGEQIIFALIKEHFNKYNSNPTKTSLSVDLSSKKIKENLFNEASEVLGDLNEVTIDVDWLSDSTEDWCKKRAFFNAILSASELLDGDDTKLYQGALDTVQSALAVSFDTNIGSDYIESAEERFESYSEEVDQLKCGIHAFDEATRGGFVEESLTILMAPTGVGKSLFLCNFAARFMMMGKNVLYLTMEMSEKQVEKRIDLNLLDMTAEEIKNSANSKYMQKIINLKRKGCGKLITKRYPAGQAHSGHFRHLIEELKLKQGFKPDVIIVDYLNICASSRVTKKNGLYEHDMEVSVELRGLGQEFGCRVFTATQTNREGTKIGNFEITDVSNSWGVTNTADYIYGIVENDDYVKLGQMLIKRLKDRYHSIYDGPSFVIGVDKTKQRIYDVEKYEYADNEMPVFDETETGNRIFDEFS